MQDVVIAGTGKRARIKDIIVCGKTGTVENYVKGVKQKDHSTFIAFAPKDNPKIAIAVYVENGGFGSTYAAPIASLMIEKFIRDSIVEPSRRAMQKQMFNASIHPRRPPVVDSLPVQPAALLDKPKPKLF